VGAAVGAGVSVTSAAGDSDTSGAVSEASCEYATPEHVADASRYRAIAGRQLNPNSPARMSDPRLALQVPLSKETGCDFGSSEDQAADISEFVLRTVRKENTEHICRCVNHNRHIRQTCPQWPAHAVSESGHHRWFDPEPFHLFPQVNSLSGAPKFFSKTFRIIRHGKIADLPIQHANRSQPGLVLLAT